MIGQIGMPFLQNSINQVSITWFSDKERPLATAIAALCQVFGLIVCLLITGAYSGAIDETVASEMINAVQKIILT